MYADVVLPNLGFGMEEGRLIAWLKKPGDPVRKGEPIAEVESDKATVELVAVVDGVLDTILAAADKVVPVGSVLARILTGEAVPQEKPTASPTTISSNDTNRITPVARRMANEHGVDLSGVTGSGPGGTITREDVQRVVDRQQQPVKPSNGARALAAPAVRKLARDRGIDLNTIAGTGKDGHVTRADVERVLAQTQVSPIPGEPAATGDGRREVSLSQVRQTIARRLAQSAQEAPHFFTTAELDFTAAIQALPKAIGINNLLLYLAVQTLKDHPDLNATYENGRLYHYDHVNLGIAVARPDGLIAPVLPRADDYSLAGLADRARDLIARARDNRLRPEELGGGTFTVSNLGIIQQIERFTAIINPPQVAILAVGAIKERPVVIDGGLHIRTTGYFTLSADHRIVDGLIAARFLESFDHRLQMYAG
ncbi:MAG: 2-oxo acid dehydrogenase subunit E2 [Anaerolineae bacterium]|nr:2-oxo acid dehydrogenase subunit E2 [Anaerolineae bacterium]